ncbi:hypothetical protein BS11774_19285 [Bacillus subtilis]|uniref:hypothetical protein n=1 Tax=Bacillus subtilis TaxID=1423 RepID=UPI000FF8E15D|nr:hypothetical protein [Bacillus subtilis]QAR62463.1 hypothetical protein BS11774_19285 [Bacillus subtilis]
MSWLEFFSTIFNSWPIAIVIIVILLRKTLMSKLGKLLSLTYKDININFQEELEKVSKSLGESESDSDSENENVLEKAREEVEFITDIAELSPSAGIIASWVSFETTIDGLIESKGVIPEGLSWSEKKRALEKLYKIDLNIYNSINHLRKFMLDVNHYSKKADDSLSLIEAIDYYELILKTSKKIIERR